MRPEAAFAQLESEAGGKVKTIVIQRRSPRAQEGVPKDVAPQPQQSGGNIETIVIRRHAPEEGTTGSEAPDPGNSGQGRLPNPDKSALDFRPGSADIAFLLNGPPLHGRLISLTGGLMQLDTSEGRRERVDSDDIAMVSFSVGRIGAPPRLSTEPTERDDGKDRVITYDGEVTSAKVSAITDSSVVTDVTSFSRADVNRILFGPDVEGIVPASSDNQHDIGEPWPPAEPSGYEAPGSSESAGDGAGSGVPHDPVEPCPDDKPLGGWLTADFVRRNHCCSGHVHFRARFPLLSRPSLPGEGKTWRDALERGFQAPRLIYQARLTGLRQTAGTEATVLSPPTGRLKSTARSMRPHRPLMIWRGWRSKG